MPLGRWCTRRKHVIHTCVVYPPLRFRRGECLFLSFQDEALDSEGPRRAFEDMAREVNELAVTAAAMVPGAPPVVFKTADDVSLDTHTRAHTNTHTRGQ